MNARTGTLLLATLLVVACGGGGGNADTGAGNGGGGGGEGGGGGDGGGSGNGGGGGTGSDAPNGTAQIVFPWTHSAATASTVTVRGIASDPEGVASVVVNGIATGIVGTGSGASLKPSLKGLREGEVEWEAEIPLAQGENDLVVSVEDAAGNVSENVDSATISYVEVPTTFTLDPEGTRVVGFSFTLTSSGYEQRLVEHDYQSLEQTIFATATPGDPALTCLRPFENEFVYLSFFTGSWELRKFDLTTAEDTLLRELPEAIWDAGAEFTATPWLGRLVCDSTHTSAYLLANYTDASGGGYRPTSAFAMSRVLEIPLDGAGPITTLSQSDTTANPRWLAMFMALSDDQIVTMEDVSPWSALTSVSLTDGSRSELTPGLEIGGVALDPVLSAGRVYVATFDGVDEIDLTGIGGAEIRNISEVDDTHPLVFSQVRSIGFDAANNRVIAGDSDLDALIAIDISTGERSEFLSRKVGTGTALIAPRRFALTADGTRAYVADEGSNAPERLFEIDLASGDRHVIGDISQSSFSVNGLALDEAGGRVFVSGGEAILEVDLETEEVETIAVADLPGLVSAGELLLDPDNGRLLVGDFVQDAVYSMDLATHAIEIVSQEGGRGAGPAFGGIVSMTRVTGTPDVYVAGQTSETIVRVNLETGDREELVANCPPAWWTDTAFQNLDQVLYNGILDTLIISGDNLYSYELETSACTALPRRLFPLHIQVTPENQMLAASFGALLHLDRDTGEVVIVSK